MGHGEGKDGNLFCEANRDMRELARADPATRERLKKAWAPFLHYCTQGVLRCPTVPQGTVTWRARPEPIASLREVYQPGYELVCVPSRPAPWTSGTLAPRRDTLRARSWSLPCWRASSSTS